MSQDRCPTAAEGFRKAGMHLRLDIEKILFLGYSVDSCKACRGNGKRGGKTWRSMEADLSQFWPKCPECNGRGSWWVDSDGQPVDEDSNPIEILPQEPDDGKLLIINRGDFDEKMRQGDIQSCGWCGSNDLDFFEDDYFPSGRIKCKECHAIKEPEHWNE